MRSRVRNAAFPASLAVVCLAACVTTDPNAALPSPSNAAGAVAGATEKAPVSTLEHCEHTLGALALSEDENAGWYRTLSQHQLGSTLPVLRLIIQQSNCFVIVERGAAMQGMAAERSLQRTGDMRGDGDFGKGQMVAADYTMVPTIDFKQTMFNWVRANMTGKAPRDFVRLAT